jgi:beta-lactam-binding protein with PASTA domain
MRVRRTFAERGLIARWLERVRERLRRGVTRTADQRPAEPDPPRPLGESGTTAPTPEVVEGVALPSRRAWWRERRFALMAAGVFGGTLVVGYLLAALVFFPAPIFASSKTVPRLIGVQEGAARETLVKDGLGVATVERAPHPSAAAGVVIWQDPPPGMVAREGTEVALTVSTGPQRIPVPDVAGYEAPDARLLLESAGLKVGSIESTQAPTPKNVAVNTRPPAGSTLPPGAAVTLVVSVGAATLRVPTLIGLTVEEARLALETAGLTLGTNFAQTTQAAAPGEIFYQEPAAGTLSAPGTPVNVRIARSGQ